MTVDPLVPQTYRVAPGEIICSSSLLPGGAWERTELYADHMHAFGLHHVFGTLLERSSPAF